MRRLERACEALRDASTRDDARRALEALRDARDAWDARTSRARVDDATELEMIDAATLACGVVLARGRCAWYESMSASDRATLVDRWFAWEEGGAWDAGAARACAEVARGRGARSRDADEAAVAGGGYLVAGVRSGVIERLMEAEARAGEGGRTRTARAYAAATAVVVGAFDAFDARFSIPVYGTVSAYEREAAVRVISGGVDAPASAAGAASRMCRRGGAAAVARATVRALAPRVRALSVEEVRKIVHEGDVPESLRWATTMMNETTDAHAASRWIAELFAQCCGGRGGDASCSWRTLDVIVRVLLRDRYWACELTRLALCETLLLRKGVPRGSLPALLRLTILRPIKAGCDAARVDASRAKNVLAVLEAWSSEDFVRGASVDLQRHLTACAAAALAATPSEEWSAMRGNPAQFILKGVSARLDAITPRARRHAGKVAMELSLKIDPSKPFRLVDAGDADETSDEECDWEREMAHIALDDVIVEEKIDEVEEIVEVVERATTVQIKTVDPDEVVDMWSARRGDADDSDDENDSDDSDDDDLVPYDIDSDDDPSMRSSDPASLTERRIASLPKPQTLRECVAALRQVRSGDASARQTDIDLADAAEGAVHTVSDLVSMQPHELASCAADLAVAVLHAHPPTPDADPLDRARRQGLATVLTVTPGLAGPPLIDHALSERCDASQVFDTLSAIEVASANLAAPRAIERTTERAQDVANRPVSVGVERRFAPKALEARSRSSTAAPTRGHLIGDCFVAPLLRATARRLERQSSADHPPDGVDAMVFGQILHTLGQCATHARNAIDAPFIGRAVLEFALAPAFADADHPHLRRAALIAGSLAASAIPTISIAHAYADASDLARALERFTELALRRRRADADADVRAAAAVAADALRALSADALTALDDIDAFSPREFTTRTSHRPLDVRAPRPASRAASAWANSHPA